MGCMGFVSWAIIVGAANGEDVAALQGGWGSVAHRSYGRDTLEQLLSVPQRAAMYAASHSLPPMPLDTLASDFLPDPNTSLPAPVEARPGARTSRAGPSSSQPLAPAPPPKSAASVEYLHEILVERKRPSARKAPVKRIIR